MDKKICAVLKIAGIIALVMALICFCLGVGTKEYEQRYGGDAYTGIQNAAVATANNVRHTNAILKFGFGSVLLVSGVTMAGIGFAGTKKEKIEEAPNEEPVAEVVAEAASEPVAE